MCEDEVAPRSGHAQRLRPGVEVGLLDRREDTSHGEVISVPRAFVIGVAPHFLRRMFRTGEIPADLRLRIFSGVLERAGQLLIDGHERTRRRAYRSKVRARLRDRGVLRTARQSEGHRDQQARSTSK
ncbi:MAG: hypothetical protein WDN28_12195 [Chthoniobacter sp.]